MASVPLRVFLDRGPENRGGDGRVLAEIGEDAWDQVAYRHPIPDPETGEWITHADIAETVHTAFTNPTTNPGQTTTARLLVRRTPRFRQNEQGELFRIWNYHAVFTDTGFDLLTADEYHRGHAIIEQVLADLNDAAHHPATTANWSWQHSYQGLFAATRTRTA